MVNLLNANMLKVACLFLLWALASASDVLEFTDSNFQDNVEEHDIILVEFYAPWCGHCKKLAPEYEKAATTLKNSDPPVPLAKVDCTGDGKDSCDKHGVKGFPTLKIFKNGEVSQDYSGPRDADGIVKYMKSKAGPSSKELKQLAEAEKFLNTDEFRIVGFFGSDDTDLYKKFQKLADALNEDFSFGHTTSKDIMDKYKHTDNFVIFRPKKLENKFEPTELVYDGEASLSTMKKFVNDKIHGFAGHRTASNSAQFKRPLIVAYYDVDYVKNTKGTNYWRNRVMKVAKKLQDAGKNVNFAVSNINDLSYEIQEYGMDSTDSDKPLIAARDSSDQKFVMKEEFSMDNLEKFANDLVDGKLSPYLKSEPVPEPNDEPVKVAVAKNFEDLVNDKTKDVLIEFYAPWCGHCKSLAPKYEELAEKLKDETDIVIAKMDATANDVPKPYEVRGFPTLYFSPKGSKDSPRKYEGGREVKDFIKYLAKESTDELKGWTRDGKKKKTSKKADGEL
jgi:protein disulfide isomerase family A protein 3